MTGLAFEVLSLNSLLSSLSLFLSLSLSPSVLFIYFCQFYVLQLLQIRENWCIPEVSFFFIGKRGTRRGSKTKTDSCIATKSLSFPSFFCQTLELYHHFSVHQISWQKLGSLKPGVCHRQKIFILIQPTLLQYLDLNLATGQKTPTKLLIQFLI